MAWRPAITKKEDNMALDLKRLLIPHAAVETSVFHTHRHTLAFQKQSWRRFQSAATWHENFPLFLHCIEPASFPNKKSTEAASGKQQHLTHSSTTTDKRAFCSLKCLVVSWRGVCSSVVRGVCVCVCVNKAYLPSTLCCLRCTLQLFCTVQLQKEWDARVRCF